MADQLQAWERLAVTAPVPAEQGQVFHQGMGPDQDVGQDHRAAAQVAPAWISAHHVEDHVDVDEHHHLCSPESLSFAKWWWLSRMLALLTTR